MRSRLKRKASSGSFANIFLTVIFMLIMWGFFAVAFTQAGASFNTYTYSLVNITSISSVNNITISEGSSILDSLQEFNETQYVEIIADDKNYVIDKNSLLEQLDITNKNIDSVFLYDDAPAIRSNITGAITEIDGVNIRNAKELEAALSKYSAGDSIIIKTEFKNDAKEHNITLAKNPYNGSRAFLGIGVIKAGRRGFFSGMIDIFSFIKEPSTYYKPRVDGLSLFIYNLLWWLIMINLGVGLFNMLPVGIFDGGQVFYLTVLGITKSEKIAKAAFSIITRVILIMFLALIVLWFFAFR